MAFLTLVKTWRIREVHQGGGNIFATKILQDGRRAGAKNFYIAGDLNMELALLCAGDEEDQELREMYGSQCWLGGEGDPWGFKEIGEVQHHEGVQVQSCFYLVAL